nr:MAG TPA: hypothetical protein [Bacteriophage sp.]
MKHISLVNLLVILLTQHLVTLCGIINQKK